jgi:putative SOS response-associated peptidase YedK
MSIKSTNAIHNRMPGIVQPDHSDRWLDPESEDGQALQQVLRRYPAETMEAHPESTLVDNPRNDVAECIERIAGRALCKTDSRRSSTT